MENPSPSPILRNKPDRLNNEKTSNDLKVYVAPTGPGVDPEVFKSERGQRTTLHYLAPTVDNAMNNKDYPLKYPNHVDSIVRAIKDQLGGKMPGLKPHKYVPLNPDNNTGDAKKMFETTRGTALFQYDSDSDGKGKRAWRLWLEDDFVAVNL